MALFKIRPANEDDCVTVMKLIEELAVYEKMPEGPQIRYQTLAEDGFGEQRFYKCFVAETASAEQAKEIVGYSLYFYTYDTCEGKNIMMEDLYVTPSFRHQGIGKALWKAVVQEGLKEGCRRTDFVVLGWNTPSIKFYKMNGAIDRTVDEKVNLFRLKFEAMKKFCATSASATKYCVRPALQTDCKSICDLIQEYTSDMPLSHVLKINTENLKNDGFLNEPVFKCLVAEQKTDGSQNNTELIGFGFYSFIYSTWEGKSIYLDDIYVRPKHRRQGVGEAIWKAVVQCALEAGCTRIQFAVSQYNAVATNFFKGYGAVDLTEEEMWHIFTLSKEAMVNFF